MAVRDDFAPGEVLAAADLNDTFGSKLNIAGGKVLQIVRATDSTLRSTTSTSFVDVTGMSVTITPQKSDSAILLIGSVGVGVENSTVANEAFFRITDASNNAVSGAEVYPLRLFAYSFSGTAGLNFGITPIGYATPAVITAVTYKLQFRVATASVFLEAQNQTQTGQLYAIEVSA
jgi:hypothetical protein